MSLHGTFPDMTRCPLKSVVCSKADVTRLPNVSDVPDDLSATWRPRDTPIWKLEAALKCRSCRKGRYAPPVHMIKLTERQEITPYRWVHPDEDDR